MKTVLVLSALLLSGCSTYSTHLRTGCIWTCDQYTTDSAYTGVGGSLVRSQQIFTPQGGYLVIQSGSTTSVIQTSRTR
jgi:hypothetical protein